MFRDFKKCLIIASTILLFILIILLVSYITLKRNSSKSTKQIETHATIITEDMWAIDKSGATSYLQLAVQANHYKRLLALQSNGEVFVDVGSEPLHGLDQFLLKCGVIRVRHLSADIARNSSIIGVLRGEQYIRIAYPLANVFVFLSLVFVIVAFMLHLIHNRKKLEEIVYERTRNLQKSEKRFHDLVNLLPEMVWESDRKGVIRYANKIAINRFGLSEKKNFLWFDLIDTDQRVKAGQEFEASMQGKGSGLQEFQAIDNSGATFPVLIRSAPIMHDGKIDGARCVAIDISERHQLEAELHQANKMKAIGMMAGGVAHDLNNILSGIVSYPELLLMSLPEDSDMRRSVEAIRKSGVEAAEVVSDLLTVARGVAASKSAKEPNRIVIDYFESPDYKRLQSLHPGVVCELFLAQDLQNIQCSPIHVRKCLMNLITNATEAIQDGGIISVTTKNKRVEQPNAHNPSLKNGDYSVITVRDTGTGISEHDLNHIFEPFYTKKMMGRSGTGLGLTVVWNTMRDHNGSVIVESFDQATSFSLYFPSTKEVVMKAEAPVGWQTFKGHGERILVIDDEERQRDISLNLLTSLDYNVECVSSGEAALAYLQRNSVDVVILDMLMEPGMNGYETFKQICEISPRQKAVIASGYSRSEDVENTLALGAGEYIIKPYSIEQLGGAVVKVLKS